ncbi:MAG: type III-A CRISPR-associated RAMP protein Csm4 [Saprospiraceae bacterium]|nr:MAG: type III-A CRISPR-associated RAMP protein Csm4 [Saprospiraceae bacterium]
MITAFKLKFTSPLHLGSVRSDYDSSETTWHSDSLYAAIIRAWCDLGLENKLEEFLLEEGGQPRDFVLSSLFPFCKSKERSLFFLPAPIGTLLPANPGLQKKVKAIRFVDHENYLFLQNKGRIYVTEDAIHQEYLTTTPEFDPDFITKKVFPRARVPRSGITNETEIYYLERIFFQQGSGLFCILQYEDELTKKRIEAMLNFLGDEGIGTDRHIGNGFFKVEEVKVEEFDVNSMTSLESEYRTNLSLFCPESKEKWNEMIDEGTKYKLLKRGGWITTPGQLTFRKQSVYMFAEGGIFKTSEPAAGKTVNLQPSDLPASMQIKKPVYRSGRSLFVPIKLNNS